MPPLILDDGAAVARLSPDLIEALTDAATATTFYRDDLSEAEHAATRRVPVMARACYASAAESRDQGFAAAFVGEVFAGFAISTRHGRRVAAALTEHAIAWLGPEKPMWLTVLRHNARAIAFYRRFGFEIDPHARTAHVVPHWIMRRPPAARR